MSVVSSLVTVDTCSCLHSWQVPMSPNYLGYHTCYSYLSGSLHLLMRIHSSSDQSQGLSFHDSLEYLDRISSYDCIRV